MRVNPWAWSRRLVALLCTGLLLRNGQATQVFSSAQIPDEFAAYLGPVGKLAAVVNASDRILRHSGQIKGPDRRNQVYTADFAAIGSRP